MSRIVTWREIQMQPEPVLVGKPNTQPSIDEGDMMKKYNGLYEKMCSAETLVDAYKFSRKGKGYKVTGIVDDDPEFYLKELQKMLKDKNYKTSEYEIFYKVDSGKKRKIANLPYFPDRIAQCACIQILEPIWIPLFIDSTCSAIPGRGQTHALMTLRNYLRNDEAVYFIKLDIVSYFETIDRDILKEIIRRKIKDQDMLNFLDEIIDSYPEHGIPIGNYTSQYFGNLYLAYFDHWVKEVLKVKYYIRYMDDMVFLFNTKEEAWDVLRAVELYLSEELHLCIKNAQPHLIDDRGIDFVGYRSFRDYKLLRTRTKGNIKAKSRVIQHKIDDGFELNEHDKGIISSYNGVLKWGDCYHLKQETISKLIDSLNQP